MEGHIVDSRVALTTENEQLFETVIGNWQYELVPILMDQAKVNPVFRLSPSQCISRCLGLSPGW